jgi:hypothetical protein
VVSYYTFLPYFGHDSIEYVIAEDGHKHFVWEKFDKGRPLWEKDEDNRK